MKTRWPAAAVATLLLLTLSAFQAPTDSLRRELIRSRGFIRAAETQLSKSLALLDAPEPGPPVVLDWQTGEWAMDVGGYRGTVDLDAQAATVDGVTAPVAATFAGDTLRVRLAVPGFEGGLLEMVHAEGRMIGTVTANGETRAASGWRDALRVVRTVEQGACTFAEYTDGSWGHAPNVGDCHDALNTYVGGMRFVAREYTP